MNAPTATARSSLPPPPPSGLTAPRGRPPTANDHGPQGFTRHPDPELGPDAPMKADKIPPQIGSAALVETARKRFRWAVTRRERVPGRLTARLTIEGGAAL